MSLQCIGAKIRCPGSTPSVTATSRIALAWSVVTRAKPTIRHTHGALASSGWISRNGAARSAQRGAGLSGARHGVPLVAHAAGVEPQRPLGARRRGQGRRLHGDESGPAIARDRSRPSANKPRPARSGLAALEPAIERAASASYAASSIPARAADIEVAAAVVLEGRERGVLAKDVGRAR